MSYSTKSGLLALVLGLPCAGAGAQDYMGPSIDYVGNHISASQFRGQIERGQVQSKRPAERQGAGASPRPGAHAGSRGPDAAHASTMRALAFKPSAAASARIRAAMATALSGSTTPDALPATRLLHATFKAHPRFRSLLAAQLGTEEGRIRERLRAGVLQSAFEQELDRYGYSSTNMGDVNNAYMIHAWGLVNNVRIDRNAVFAGQRAKLQRSIRDGLRAPDIGDVEKQEYCEVVGMLTMLTGSAWNKATPADKPILQAGMRDIARRMGLDLSAVKLTASGFSG
ncbi:MAG TPA: hypothetical protein VLK29_05530 [Luteimonas sp.]|nr:hypothetical protein [Luteimonas sp.]